jgi:hypothetical protein
VGGKKHRGEDDDDEASKDAEESSQDHSIIQEVNLKPSSGSNSNSNPSNASRSKDSETQPIKGGVVLDLDEDGDKGEDSQTGRGQDGQDAKDDGQVFLLNFILIFTQKYGLHRKLLFNLFSNILSLFYLFFRLNICYIIYDYYFRRIM